MLKERNEFQRTCYLIRKATGCFNQEPSFNCTIYIDEAEVKTFKFIHLVDIFKKIYDLFDSACSKSRVVSAFESMLESFNVNKDNSVYTDYEFIIPTESKIFKFEISFATKNGIHYVKKEGDQEMSIDQEMFKQVPAFNEEYFEGRLFLFMSKGNFDEPVICSVNDVANNRLSLKPIGTETGATFDVYIDDVIDGIVKLEPAKIFTFNQEKIIKDSINTLLGIHKIITNGDLIDEELYDIKIMTNKIVDDLKSLEEYLEE